MVHIKKNQKSTLKPKALKISEWLLQQSKKDTLRFITCGSVDDGKSTLIGRLLYESHQVFDDQFSSLQADSKRFGTQGNNIDFALLVDGLTAEREQGITIDVAYRFFSTERRKFIVSDTPGHEQYTRNMVTGASTANLAVLLIDATKGATTQTRRHAYLVSLLGIKHVVLAINKIDLINYNKEHFESITENFFAVSKNLKFETVTPIPLSALKGDNITIQSANTPWYRGPTLISFLETINIQQSLELKTVFPVQLVNRPSSNFRGFSGTLVSGKLKIGDSIRVSKSGKTAILSQIINGNENVDEAQAGKALTLILDKEIDISRGDVITHANQPLNMTDQFEATLIWMHDEVGLVGRTYEIKLANQWASASITNLKYSVNVNTQTHETCTKLSLNDIAVANLALSKPLAFEPYSENTTMGSFILIDKFNHATLAAGMIKHNLRRAQNIHKQELSVKRKDREYLNGHKGKVIWFTGLSGSGKSTIANALEKKLHSQGKRTYILDGDNIRHGLNKDLGFTEADRVENIRRIAEVAKLMMDSGLIVLTAFISPYKYDREMARALIGQQDFIEVYVNTPLDICEQRDAKGLYKLARNGSIPNMTGINSPYEPPNNPEIIINTETDSVETSVEKIYKNLE